MKINFINLNNFTGKNNIQNSKKTANEAPKSTPEENSGLKTGYYLPLNFRGNEKKPSVSSILNFIETNRPYSEAGLKGVVYKMDSKNGPLAIKVGRSIENDFSHEAEILKRVPDDISGQKFVDYFKDPKTGKDILVSTFSSGTKGTMQKKEDFLKLFSVLNALDNAGVLHGDLNMGNWLFDDGEINLIDYGEGSLFNAGDTYEEMYPDFIVKTNIINLEQNGIPDCIQKWHKKGIDTKEAFKSYLEAKAEFYKKHKETAAKTGNKRAYDYESNLTEVLNNPDDDIIENEARRMDILCTFEQSDTAVNYAKYPDSAIRNWKLTIKKAQAMLDKTREMLEDDNLSPEKRKYFEYQYKIAKTFLETFKDWGNGTISWIKGIETKPKEELSEHEKTLKDNKGKQMELPPDLVSMVN